MSLIFNPSGLLDINTDPSDLGESGDGRTFVSQALTRAKNVDLISEGKSKTRKGTATNGTQLAKAASRIEVVGSNRYEFADTIIYRNGTSIATGLNNAEWSSIQYNAFNDTTDNIFALNGTDLKRVEASSVYTWGIAAPTTDPVVSAGAAGSLSGAYLIKYTYVRKVGSVVVSESNPSDASNSVTLSSQVLSFTFTDPTDSQVTHIRIYRTAAGGSTYKYDQEIALSVESGTSSQADSALGDTVATDHTTPPAGQFIKGPNYNGTCFMIKDNLLYYCLPKQPEYWPATYFIEVSTLQFPGQTIVFWNGQPYYLTKKEIYFIQGTAHPAFQPIKMDAKTGCQGRQAAWAVDEDGIYHVGYDGLYLFRGGTDKKITERTLDPIFTGTSVNGIPAASTLTTSWLFEFKNKLYFGYQSSTDTAYPSNVLVMYLDSKKVVYYSYPFEIRTVQIDDYNDVFIAGCGDYYIRTLETGTQDSSTDISWELQSKDFTLPTRAHFPRWIKYDIEVGGTVTGEIILDGTSLQSHTITGSRNTKRRLIATDNGERCSIKITGTGVSTVYGAEME